MLRLIHALVDHDDVKSAYLTRHDLPSGRMAIENRNTVEAHTGTVWQMLVPLCKDLIQAQDLGMQVLEFHQSLDISTDSQKTMI